MAEEQGTQVATETQSSSQPAQEYHAPEGPGANGSVADYLNTDPSKGGSWTNPDGSFWNEGVYYDKNGNPVNQQQKQDQNTQNAQSEKPAEQKTQEPTKPGNPQQPTGIDSLFYTDQNGKSEFSVEKSIEFFGKTASSPYKPAYETIQQQEANAQQEKTTEPQKPLTIAEEIKQLKTSLYNNSSLPYLDELYRKHGSNMPPELLEDIKQRYSAESAKIEDVLEEKRAELYESRLTKKDTEASVSVDNAKTEEAYKQSFAKVSSEFGGPEKFEQFMFGYKDEKGNVHKGIGAEVLDFIFDINNDPKALQGKKVSDVYKQWAIKFMSNENNMRMASRLALGLYNMQNMPKYRDAFRSAWEKENAQRKEATIKQGLSGNSSPNTASRYSPELQQYLTGQRQVDTV